ncbi:MAG: hypothetical protein ACOVQA_02675, partial [Thermoflexibacteraceae bacterium]
YYTDNKAIYLFCVIMAFVCQVASGVSSYTFYSELLAIKLTGYGLVAACLGLLVIVEVAKYYTSHKLLKEYFSLSKPNLNTPLLIITGCLVALSVYASVMGGGKLGIDTIKIVSTQANYDEEINTLRQEIADITKRNSYKGNVWIGKEDKALLLAKEAEMQRLKAEKQASVNALHAANTQAEHAYRFLFGVFDVLFLFATVYVWYFRKRVAVESFVNTTAHASVVNSYAATHAPVQDYTDLHAPVQNPSDLHAPVLPRTRTRIERLVQSTRNRAKMPPTTEKPPIGFRLPTKQVHVGIEMECEQCGKVHLKQTADQRYCSDTCRYNAHNRKRKGVLERLKYEHLPKLFVGLFAFGLTACSVAAPPKVVEPKHRSFTIHEKPALLLEPIRKPVNTKEL